MSRIPYVVRLRRLAPLAILAVLPACRTAQETPPPAPPPPPATMQMTQEQQGSGTAGAKEKVKVVEVDLETDGSIKPIPPVKIKKNRDIIVWVTNGTKLDITWKAKDPLPRMVCDGSFCGSLMPSSADPGIYSYKVTVDGKYLDPDVEVEGGP